MKWKLTEAGLFLSCCVFHNLLSSLLLLTLAGMVLIDVLKMVPDDK